jgi:hypothetical protein
MESDVRHSQGIARGFHMEQRRKSLQILISPLRQAFCLPFNEELNSIFPEV